ncbi:uncharacterized protein E5676_scaffold323G00270 [Cucumis melo var. makuwa]|uniref:Uncharacterized protein n=1 Tax=Cucumis melo var. makuwa TaxID=1194695 RepID=A0A5A7U4S8_CUCMM|nr:uncharacterized protein E6C27_scaffold404G001220 [Cucumis melo var. makuwa]TYK08499.1 uncharacterized protein E5676_scaffold323G00270 [Cucumis melo var. makuwa]
MENPDQVNSSPTTTNPSMSSTSDENDQNYPSYVSNLNCPIDPKFTENSLSEIPNVDLDSVFQASLPYDPLTNYLSPRPRFLRYKPSKRREIFLRTFGEDSLSVSHTSSSEEKGTNIKEEEEQLEVESEGKSNAIDDEGEGDEEEANRGWKLLKFLVVVVSLISSTLYISSMNSASPSFEVSGAFRSGSFPILNHTIEFWSSPVVESVYGNGRNFWDEEVTESESMRNCEGVGQLVEKREKPLAGQCITEEMAEGETSSVELLNFGDTGDRKRIKEPEMSNATTSVPCETSEKNEITEASNVNGLDEVKLLSNISTAAENEYASQMKVVEKEKEEDLEMIENNTGQSESFVLEVDKITQASNVNGFDEDKLLSNILTVAKNEYTPQMEVVEKEEVGDLEMVESNTGKSESFVIEEDKVTILDGIKNRLSSFVEDLEKLKSKLVELMHTETESVLKAVLGLSVSSAVLTCLVSSFQLKKNLDDTKVPAISVSVEPLLQGPVAKAEKVTVRKSSSIKATRDVNRTNNEIIRNVDSFKKLSSSIHSRDEGENFKEMHHNEASTVQFLGEFVVGEISNSLKNKGKLKNWMMEVEDSNFAGSVEEEPVSKNKTSGPEQALSEFSATTSSPSYGSFTTKKKIVKKEVGGDGEVKSIPTPVRRSNRIRNRMMK